MTSKYIGNVSNFGTENLEGVSTVHVCSI